MPRTGSTPSIVPNGADQTVYLVVDRFGALGTAYRETDVVRTDLETTITDLISGQFSDPVRVVAFNTAERWAQDASRDIALEKNFWSYGRTQNLLRRLLRCSLSNMPGHCGNGVCPSRPALFI
jgi:hypothetical protein